MVSEPLTVMVEPLLARAAPDRTAAASRKPERRWADDFIVLFGAKSLRCRCQSRVASVTTG